jgi:hypothetical protein
MLKPMRITGDDRRFVAVHVISMIAVTARMVTAFLVFVVVVVEFTRGVVAMDVRMVSSTMAMIEGAHYIGLMRANRKWSLHTRNEKSPFRLCVNAVSRLESCRTGDRQYPVDKQERARTRSLEVLSP